MKNRLSIFLLSLLILSSYAQDGIPYISYFEDNEYIEGQNWSICQDSDNIMLFANRRGLLSYDGYNWKLTQLEYIPIHISRSPADGRIYMGANNNYGILEKTRTGRYEYFSLSGDTARPGLISDIIFTDTTVIYYSGKSISVHRLDNPSEYKRWYSAPESPFTGMIAHRGKLFFNVEGQGLYRIESDTLFPIVTGYLTENRDILFALPYNDEKILIGTDDNRLQLFDRILYHDYEISNPAYLKENILSNAVMISDSLIALSTLYGGIMVIDRSTGEQLTLLNYQNGLHDDEIYAINTDNNDGLWISHGYGLCRVDFRLPVSSYSHYPGLEGAITSTLYHDGQLYVGTNKGLYFLDQVKEYDTREVLYRKPPSTAAVDENEEQEEREEQEEQQIREKEKKPVRNFFNRLFGKQEEAGEEKAGAGKAGEIRQEEKQQPAKAAVPQYGKRTVSVLSSINYVYRNIEETDNRCIQLLPAGKGIMAVTSSGLYYIENMKAEEIKASRSINCIIRFRENMFLAGTGSGLLEIKKNKGSWETKRLSGITGVDKPVYNIVNIDSSEIWLGSDNSIISLSGSWHQKNIRAHVYPFRHEYPVKYKAVYANDSIFAFAETGIYYYSADSSSFMVYSNNELDLQAGKQYKYILTDRGHPLIRTGDEWKSLDKESAGICRAENILRLFDDPVFISIGDSGSIWLSDKENNIYRIEIPEEKGRDTDFKMFIEEVSSEENNFYELDNIVFNPDEKPIFINISAPYYLKTTSTRYQFIIEGLMKTWSGWNTSPEINLVLEPGDYTVRFRAMNILGELSEEKTLSFTIKPPFTKSVWFYILTGIVVAGLLFLLVVMREKKLKHDKRVLEEKVRQRTLEIQEKKEQIEKQRDEIISQKEEITSSITYASRIQTAMLPGRQLFRETFKDHFILFMPRDIVSGDFYWVAGSRDCIYFAAADCTGHGVPGAFMSMLGISLLNEISSDGKNDLKPSEILNILRSKVVTSLSHTEKGNKAIDGMDISFCRYDRRKKLLSYAGAFNPLYHFRNGKLTVYKADRMPVGYHIRTTGSFNDKQINIKPGDIIYVFSDGFADQFGGPEDKKFSTRRLKSLLSELIDLPLDEQYDALENRFMQWKGNREQLDDIILMGIKF